MRYYAQMAPRGGLRSECADHRRPRPVARPWCGVGIAGVVLACAGVLALGQFAYAASPEMQPGGTYDEAVRAIPFDRLTDDAQGKLWKIVSQPSLYRRLPVTRVATDPELYLFLVRYPEVVVNMWDLMGVTKVNIRRNGDYSFDASDGSGTTSKIDLIYGDRQTHVMLAEGQYEGPLLKRLVHGRCLMLLRSDYGRQPDGDTLVTHQLDVFLQLDSAGAEVMAKTLYPVVGQTADHNFVEATRFLGQVSQAAETRPNGVQQLAGRLNKVDPAIRQRFATIAAEVYQRANGVVAEQARRE